MIEESTVFVLGAGVSCAEPYRYPLGRGLKERITRGGSQHNERVRRALYTYYGYRFSETLNTWIEDDEVPPLKIREELETEVIQFTDTFKNSPLSSIDAFLQQNPQFGEMGKIAIAASLLPFELSGNLWTSFEQSETWLDILFKKMMEGATKKTFKDNQLRIITFNYDRLVEYYFFNALMNTFVGIDENEAAAVLQESLPIVHIHGLLGKPHFMSEGGRPYGDSQAREALEKSVANMRIIYEEIDDSPEMALAHEWIKKAEVLCFLGFGYHPENMRRLDVETLFRGSRILGTCSGMEENERDLVGRRFKYDTVNHQGKTNTSRYQIYVYLGDIDENAAIFLRRRKVFGT